MNYFDTKLNNIVIFPDTNILLNHCAELLEISKSQELKLVISPTVFTELDNIKDGRSKQYTQEKKRNAREAIGSLNDYEKSNNLIEFLKSQKYPQYITKNDDKIIYDIKNYQANQNIEKYFLSLDTANRTRYKHTITFIDFLDRFETYKENIIHNKTTNDLFKKIQNLDKNPLDENSKRIIQNLIQHEDININAYNQNKLTLLILAIQQKNIELVNMLLKAKNIDINKHDFTNLRMTPLAHAVQEDLIEIVKILLQNGAKAHIGNKGKNKGNTPFLIACYDNKKNALSILKLLYQHNVSIHQADGNGFNGLIKAAIKGHEKIAQWLLDEGIDTKLVDLDGKTALDHAKEKIKHCNKPDMRQKYQKIIELIKQKEKNDR